MLSNELITVKTWRVSNYLIVSEVTNRWTRKQKSNIKVYFSGNKKMKVT